MKKITFVLGFLVILSLENVAFFGGSKVPDEAPKYTNSKINEIINRQEKVLRSGEFKNKKLKGTFQIIEVDNDTKFLIFDKNFAVDKAPDLKVMFSPHHLDYLNDKNAEKDALSLGLVQKYNGLQAYKLPENFNVKLYRTLIIHCEEYSKLFGGAALTIKSAFSRTDVEYGKGMKGYYVYPNDKQNLPALILIHEWWGLNQNIKEYADKFAKYGYAVLVVDLYKGKNTNELGEAKKIAEQVQKEPEIVLDNLKNAVKYLKKQKNIDATNLATVGWGVGGNWAYQMAKNNLNVKAVVIYYGEFNPKDNVSMIKARIQGHFAEKDINIKVNNVKTWMTKLKGTNVGHEIYIYPNTQHGFANSTKKYYSKEDSEKAWERTLKFLNSALKH